LAGPDFLCLDMVSKNAIPFTNMMHDVKCNCYTFVWWYNCFWNFSGKL